MTKNAENLEARTNLILLMTANAENEKSKKLDKEKSVGKTRNRTRQTHHRAIQIFPTAVTIDARDAKIRRAIRNRALSNYAQG